ncbi:hypothetical protein E2562_030772 [Oryza meyeriana var. granulata]|uniref:Uncharacterized protein n=1 Tax=Oryza meyeriana var. granulata TaxID=110450 RepID=A0A6G1CBB3_9ORYZ|nr:hypothetical protein E2562_030772 [Oryza meyeriana var. granulata]
MAIVLDAFASYVGDLLKQVTQDELTVLLCVSGEIASLEDRLRSLNDYLADAERRRITDQSVQGWVRKLKDAMYDATDILDLCHLKAIQRGHRGGASSSAPAGCLDRLLFCLRNPLFTHDIGTRIRALNGRLDAICKSASDFSFLKLEAYEDMTVATRRPAADRKTDPVLERSAVVGEKIEEDTRALVKRLTNGKHKDQNKATTASIMVVAVVGTGGIGKTTLAKKVFNDETIQEAFDKKIWLSVTQEVNEVELLRTAIAAASNSMLIGDARDKSLLMVALVDAIRDKKFFLVLDDVWSDRAWTGLLKAPFSHGAAGSRVLLTTRHDAVARGMQAAQPFHHVDKLCPEDAWSLLKKQVASSEMEEHEIDETLKDIGMEIVDKCGGLPLAVKVMGGLLCKKEKRRADWKKVVHDSICLQELGPLSQLRVLGLSKLENVPDVSFATEARLGEKSHLRLGENGLVEDQEGVSKEEQRRIEEVFDELTPPLSLEHIEIRGYFGERLPRWMMSRRAGTYERLMIVMMADLACCTQLPDGLCQLPCLHFFQVDRAPAIKRVGPEFLTVHPSSSQRRHAHAFPRLKTMQLRMEEWEEWEWEQLNNVQAMPALEELALDNCKLRRLPPGLSSQATALTSMILQNIKQLNSVEGFASLVNLALFDNPDLERVASLPRLQKLIIVRCPKMMALEEVPELQKLKLHDMDMEELPGYLLKDVSPKHLLLHCSLELLTSIAVGESSPEWSKLSHIQHVKAYADQGGNKRKWHVSYTTDPYSFETNIGNSSSSS